jgi:transglutaminase-like putative cysteine protease
MVRLQFTLDLSYDVGGRSDFLFNIAAARTPYQQVLAERFDVNRPTTNAWFNEPHFGNRLLRLGADAGPLNIAYSVTVDIRHAFGEPNTIPESHVSDIPPEVLPFLFASRYCQSDRLVEFAHAEFGKLPSGYMRVEAIREWVYRHVKFMVGASNTSTGALDTLADSRGVCRDFAHLMIALCRAINIPARFVTGIDYGADPALGPVDFHAYVEAWLGGRWYIFDATGISPKTGLVRLATGRDAADVPFATMFGPVRAYAPKVSIVAIEDATNGLVLPQHTDLAVSTAGSEEEQAHVQGVNQDSNLVPFPGAFERGVRQYG